MKHIKLSVVILVRNEEKNIVDCLERLRNVSEIIIIDDFSTDRSIDVIRSLKLKNVKVHKRKLNGNFSQQRNYGLKVAKNDWVLFIDADERVSEKLLDEINEEIKNNKKSGFYIKRRDVLWGKKLKYGETGNTLLLRLARKNASKWSGEVHEIWNIKGGLGSLVHEIEHFPHQSISEFIAEVNFYSTLRASELFRKRERASLLDIIIYPSAKFLLNYFCRFGFRDGLPGLVVAIIMSFHSYLVRAKLWLLRG